MVEGIRVVRGPDWEHGDLDGGKDHLGTVVESNGKDTVTVCWDTGFSTTCTAGKDKKHDLLVFDSGPIGINHPGVICSSCQEPRIFGTRWSCTTCYNFNLCTPCYHDDELDLSHTFTRIDLPNGSRTIVSERCNSKRHRSYGFYPPAKVKRRKDLEEETNNNDIKIGTVEDVVNYSDDRCTRNAVWVEWSDKQHELFRLGADENIDIFCVQAAGGADYYQEHLPTLDIISTETWIRENSTFQIGDCVCIEANKNDLSSLIRGVKLEQIQKIVGYIGYVTRIGNDDVLVQFENKIQYAVPRNAIRKVFTFNIGDAVRVYGEKEKVQKFQLKTRFWNDNMQSCLGDIGTVQDIVSNIEVMVLFHTEVWSFHRACLYPAFGERVAAPTQETLDLYHQKMLALSKIPETLVEAIIKNDIETVESIIRAHPNVKDVLVKDLAPLHYAVDEGHKGVVTFLLDVGADVNIKGKLDSTPLFSAILRKHEDVALLLIDRKADMTVTDKYGSTPLHKASQMNLVEVVRRLLAAECYPNCQDEDGNTPVHEAVESKSSRVLDLLLSHRPLNLRLQNKKHLNPFHTAILVGLTQVVNKMLSIDPVLAHSEAAEGFKPIHLAVTKRHGDITRILITKGGTDVNSENAMGMTALHVAVSEGHQDMVRLLLRNSANVNAQDRFGNTPLHLCTISMKMPTTSHVPENRSIKNVQPEAEKTSIAKLLIDNEADVNLLNKQGATSLSICSSDSIRQQLREYIKHRQLLAQATRKYPNPIPMPTQDSRAHNRQKNSKQTHPMTYTPQNSLEDPDLKCYDCGVRSNSIRFLPCKHRLTCTKCCRKFSVCPLCHQRITGNVVHASR